MKIKMKIMTTLLGVLFGCGIAASQTPKAEQAMDSKRQHIAEVATLTSMGDLDKLKTVLTDGLNDGMTVSKLKEVMVHTYAYCGFPRALRGLQTLVAVLDERKAKGFEDDWGREASPITDTRRKYERGRDILAEISGVPVDAPKADYAVLAPEIEVFLKEHLFADLFERDVLTYAERELTTVAVIASLGKGVEPMLKGHMGIALNVGVTPDELRGVLAIVEKNVGRSEADGGRLVLNELLQSKGLIANPETPVETVENGVKKQKVTFHNRFLIDVVGDLYFPANYDSAKKYAAIIVGHPFGGVKEQTSGLHARKLAEMGYVTLAFDASYYGESGGYPRRMESPEVRVEDFSAAVDFLSNHPAVDTDKIGVIGICGGGCYSVNATQIDHRIKALATISMYDMGRARRQGVGDTQTYEQRMAILDELGRQRTAEYGGATRRDIRALPEKVDENTPKFAIDFLDYYDNPQRGQHPNSTGYYSYTSLAPMMNFFPFAQIETISPRPVLFIVGENAVSKYFSEDAYEKAAEPKELFVVPEATHVDLYDQPKYLKITIPKLDAFFKQYLK
ncbi:carboxymuconolactone decarboxylase family protein [Bacteroides fragilis]|uniref:alpha/beta fold hydrolase n=1 Tax=Bacteroides fragilis TaxID=817 RepID=UPI002200254E|nr:alpha/beta fold hydrolase [Bacteroides fragilis]MCS2374515.1 carboxymuconolactone decarboxylase family protein [Bacteroides fragilis]MCZ2548215.1 carboxymuconolactone decarboxylase family protein [Bacteroides fragilis]UVR30074.1 carboxymuconolactone decarboxylase family protein [Bacteroides fragilis]